MSVYARGFTRPLQSIVRKAPYSRPSIQTRLESSSSSSPSTSSQTSASPQPPPSSNPAAEPHPQNIYKQFGRPFAKVFLGAMLTYQVLYWFWEKLRIDEEKRNKLGEVKSLEDEIQKYKLDKSGEANG